MSYISLFFHSWLKLFIRKKNQIYLWTKKGPPAVYQVFSGCIMRSPIVLRDSVIGHFSAWIRVTESKVKIKWMREMTYFQPNLYVMRDSNAWWLLIHQCFFFSFSLEPKVSTETDRRVEKGTCAVKKWEHFGAREVPFFQLSRQPTTRTSTRWYIWLSIH